MNCQQAQHHIYSGVESDSNDPDNLDVVRHISACPVCQRVQLELDRTVGVWRKEVAEAPTPDAIIEWQKLRRTLRSQPASRRGFAWLALPLTAAAAAVLGVHFWPTPPTTAPERTVAINSPAVRSGDVREESGSTVVFVDDKSGWTFVWSPDASGSRHI